MRTAREVIADGLDHEALIDAFAQYVRKRDDWLQAVVELHDDVDEVKAAAENERAVLARSLTDATIAALRAEGLVIVAAADVAMADSFVKSMCASFTARGHDMADYYLLADRLDAALAAGGTDGQS